MMFTFLKVILMILEVLVCIMLIGVILLQRTKSQGAGGLAFGAGMGEQIFGTQAGNVLTRTTIILGVIFLVNTTALSVIYSRHHGPRSVMDDIPVSTTAPQSMAPPPGEQVPTPSPAEPPPASESTPVEIPTQPSPAAP